jgi:hypothetical protein
MRFGHIVGLCGVILASGVVVSAQAPAENRDLLGAWIASARQAYPLVRDYTCTYVKKERVNGAIKDDQIAQMVVRTNPLAIRLKIVAPKNDVGREIVYVADAKGPKIRTKSAGTIGLVGWSSIDPNDPKASAGTRQPVSDAGIGRLIEKVAADHAAAMANGKPPVVLATPAVYDKRPSVRLDVTDATADGVHHPFRSVVWFDKQTNLPMRRETYDRRGGLIDCASYIDVRYNLGVNDSIFNP